MLLIGGFRCSATYASPHFFVFVYTSTSYDVMNGGHVTSSPKVKIAHMFEQRRRRNIFSKLFKEKKITSIDDTIETIVLSGNCEKNHFYFTKYCNGDAAADTGTDTHKRDHD